jgi:hypothetical protein
LDEVLVCLSNWHVFCPNGNSTTIGHPVALDFEQVAHVHFFYPVFASAVNLWDLALAAYDDTSAPLAQMRPCDDGTVTPYPQKFSEDINPGGAYRKVGERAPICRTGNLTGVHDTLVDYPGAGSVHFQEQLFFSKMSDPGDSGSVILDTRDNRVTGLNFAGNQTETVANPIFRLGWTFAGTRVRSGVEFPAFTKTTETLMHPRSAPARKADDFPHIETPPLPPIFAINKAVIQSGGNALVLEQLLGEWGLFRGNLGPQIPRAWIHIPSQPGFWSDA